MRAYFSDLLIVGLVRAEQVHVRLGNRRFRELGALQEAIPGLDGIDARDDGDSDSGLSDSLYPIDENLYIVEHLCEDERRAGFNLLFQPLELKSEFLRGQGHMLWEPCDRDLEVIPVMLPNMSNEINSVTKASLNGCPGILTSRRVSSKSEDVPAAM